MYSIKWNKTPVELKERIRFMHEGNMLFGIVVAWNRAFTNLIVEVDVLSY